MNVKSRQLVLLCSAVLAQAAAHAESTTLGEVFVTAQKREEPLVDVPMAVTAISGRQLELRSLNSIQDISFAVPGMAMREDGPGSYTIFMRGLSNQYGNDALVGVYLDEAPVSLSGYDQLDTRVLDLERIEVLKGPQGTLYGLGSVAGAVRYITRKPRLDAFEGSFQASVASVSGGDNKESVSGVVSVPLAQDKFAVRLAGVLERGGGWQDQVQAGIRDGNDQDLEHVRLKALWQPTEATAVEAMVAVHRNESRLGLGYENPDRTITVAVDRAAVLLPKKFEYDLYNLTVSHDFGGVRLLSASTYVDHDHQYPFSYIGGPQTIYAGELEGNDDRWVTARQFAQEVRLNSDGEGRLHWTAGAYYRDVKRSLLAIYDTLYFGVVYPDAVYFDANTSKSHALFADASYEVSERVTLGAGVRYFEDRQSTSDGVDTERDTFDSVDPRFYASFAVNDNVNLYASIAKGFRSGGFNAGALPNHDPESLWNYEVGAKGSNASGNLGFEVAAFFSDYDDMLRRGLVFDSGTAQFLSLTTNIGKVEVKGLEGGITWQATEALTINATAAYIDSEIIEVNATDATSLPGDPVDYVPEFSFTVGGQQEFHWAPEIPGFVRLDYSYRDAVTYVDRTSFPAANLPQAADSIGLLDARIGASFGRFDLELYGTNLTDENKWIDPYHGWTNANRTRPRTVGLQLRVDFD